MINWYLLKDGNDDAFVTEALILAGSSDTSYKLQAGLWAARTGQKVMRGVWLEAACSTYSLWCHMAFQEHI